MLRGKRPASVTTLAIIGIIFASIGSLGVCGLAFLISGSSLLKQDPFNAALLQDPVYFGHQVVASILHLVITVILWIGSIGSLQLKPMARISMIIYAWASIVLLVANVIVQYVYILPNVLPKAIAAVRTAGTMPPQALEMVQSIFAVMIPVVLVLGSAFPVCILIFYTRKKVVDAFNGIFEQPNPGYYGEQYYPPLPPQPPQGGYQ